MMADGIYIVGVTSGREGIPVGATLRRSSKLLVRLVGGFAFVLLLNGCLNPFAPEEGSAGEQTWTDQKTVRGLLDNFELSYDYRDSLRYADCLARSFVFSYYDEKNGRADRWFRDTDLKTTGGLFRYYDKIDLEWNFIPVYAENFSQPDTTLDFIVKFNLTFGEEPPLMGYAHFSVRMGDDGRFRVLQWRDNL